LCGVVASGDATERPVGFLTSPLTGGYSGPIVVDMEREVWDSTTDSIEAIERVHGRADLCEDCDQYHEPLPVCPYEHKRRLQDFEEEEMDRAEFARHDRRLFG
jgi:hypothetical protein